MKLTSKKPKHSPFVLELDASQFLLSSHVDKRKKEGLQCFYETPKCVHVRDGKKLVEILKLIGH